MKQIKLLDKLRTSQYYLDVTRKRCERVVHKRSESDICRSDFGRVLEILSRHAVVRDETTQFVWFNSPIFSAIFLLDDIEYICK